MNTPIDSETTTAPPVGSSDLLACGETLRGSAHGANATIIAITPSGVTLHHASGTIRTNKWNSLYQWCRFAKRPMAYGKWRAIIEATRKQANEKVSDAPH